MMGRFGLLAVVVALGSGCGDELSMDLHFENVGGEKAIVSIEYDDPVFDAVYGEFDLDAWDDWYASFPAETGWVDVEVRRASDGLVLYHELLWPEDFEREGGTIHVTVYP